MFLIPPPHGRCHVYPLTRIAINNVQNAKPWVFHLSIPTESGHWFFDVEELNDPNYYLFYNHRVIR